MTGIRSRGLLLVLSSPSGAGKTTMARRLLDAERNLELSVSVTTRARRRGEVDGKDYRFVGDDRFERMVDRGELLEHATVFGNRYGTPREPVERALGGGVDMLFDVDWQGARQLRASASGEDIVSAFVLPPSAAELHRRLLGRGLDTEDVVRRRLTEASAEIGHWDAYDYVLVNDRLDESVAQIRAILRAERLRRGRRTGLRRFVEGLQRDLREVRIGR